MAKMKITVLKTMNFNQLYGDKPPIAFNDAPQCPRLTEGQEFIFDPGQLPAGFCPWAFSDLYTAIAHLRFGGGFPWVKNKREMLSCCSDGARPVLFKIELLEP